jgi:polyferredoxin
MNDVDKDRKVLWLTGRQLVATGLLIAITANVAAVSNWSNLFTLPRGTSIRPMGQTGEAFTIAGWSALFGLPVSISGLVLSRRYWRWLAALAIVLSLTPLPVGILYFHWAVDAMGLYLAP